MNDLRKVVAIILIASVLLGSLPTMFTRLLAQLLDEPCHRVIDQTAIPPRRANNILPHGSLLDYRYGLSQGPPMIGILSA